MFRFRWFAAIFTEESGLETPEVVGNSTGGIVAAAVALAVLFTSILPSETSWIEGLVQRPQNY